MQSMYIIKKNEFVVQDNEMWPRMQAARYGRNPATCTSNMVAASKATKEVAKAKTTKQSYMVAEFCDLCYWAPQDQNAESWENHAMDHLSASSAMAPTSWRGVRRAFPGP
jgi:hypothetical protein